MPSESPEPRLDLRTQRMELLQRFAMHRVEHALMEGDLVRFKSGLSPYNDETNMGTAFIFWRSLHPDYEGDCEIRSDALKKGMPDVDCVVAFISPCSGALGYSPADTRTLEPIPLAEKQALAPMLQLLPGALPASVSEAAS